MSTPDRIESPDRGVHNTLAGFVIESETITETPIREETDDQYGRRANEEVYDTRTELRLTIFGKNGAPDINSVISTFAGAAQYKYITYGGAIYVVDSIEEAGTYNGKRRWNISAHKYDNFPPQS